MSLKLTSPAFPDGELIPSRYTCDAPEQINSKVPSPELNISGVPVTTRSLALVMDDADIPESVKQARGIEKFNHWVLYNIPANTTVIREAEVAGVEGVTTVGLSGYVPPCPPDREHRYSFRLYALPVLLEFGHPPTLDEVEARALEVMLDSAVLVGRYERIISH